MSENKFKNGFVVGKFAPFHNGHKYLIDTALSQCEHVFVLSYTSQKFPKCDAATRRHWLETTYNDEIDAGKLIVHVVDPELDRSMPDDSKPGWVHREYCRMKCWERFTYDVNAVFASETYGVMLAGEIYKDCEFVMVDEDRKQFPVSGTKIRGMAKKDWRSIEELVPAVTFASYIPKVLFLGGESTGKSTICEAAAKHYRCMMVKEYGREFGESSDNQYDFPDMEHIAKNQLWREREAEALAIHNDDFIFCDTSALTTYWYSEQFFGITTPTLGRMAFESLKRYDYVFLCDMDIPFDQDGTRQDENFRVHGQMYFKTWLNIHHVPYTILRGSVEQRLETVKTILCK